MFICLTLGASLLVTSAISVTLKAENMNLTKYSRWAGNRDSVATIYLSPMVTRPSELYRNQCIMKLMNYFSIRQNKEALCDNIF
mgnify:CR=1 FL=1